MNTPDRTGHVIRPSAAPGGVGVGDWRLRARCRDATDDFFAVDRESGAARDRRVAKAKKLCAECPVLWECRAYALTTREPHGIWGGMSEGERHTARARR